MENLPLSYFAIGARRQYSQYWIIHYYVHRTDDLYTSFGLAFPAAGYVHSCFLWTSFFSVLLLSTCSIFLILAISRYTDKLIEQFVKLNTKLNRKLQPNQISLYFYYYIFMVHLEHIAFEMKSEILSYLCLYCSSLLAKMECMFVSGGIIHGKNVETFAVKCEFRIK